MMDLLRKERPFVLIVGSITAIVVVGKLMQKIIVVTLRRLQEVYLAIREGY